MVGSSNANSAKRSVASAHKAAAVPPTSAHGQKSRQTVSSGLSALQSAAGATIVKSGGSATKGAKASTTASSRDSSVSAADTAVLIKPQVPETKPLLRPEPLRKLIPKEHSRYASDVGFMLLRWFCSSAPHEVLLKHLGLAQTLSWGVESSSVRDFLLALRDRTIDLPDYAAFQRRRPVDISELLLQDAERIRVASACCNHVADLLPLIAVEPFSFAPRRLNEGLELLPEDIQHDLKSKATVSETIQKFLRVIVAAVPVAGRPDVNSQFGGSHHWLRTYAESTVAAEPRQFTVAEATNVINLVRRVAIMTVSWYKATLIRPVIGDAQAPSAASDIASSLTRLLREWPPVGQPSYTCHMELRPLPRLGGALDAAAVKDCDLFEPNTRIVMSAILASLDAAALPAADAWFDTKQLPSSSSLKLRCGVEIGINRERTIATAFALCDQHRLYGLPTMLRHLRKKQTSWAALSASDLPRVAQSPAPAGGGVEGASGESNLFSLFPTARDLPTEWFDVEANTDSGRWSLDRATVDAANREVLKTVLGKEISAPTLDEAEALQAAKETVVDDGIQFVAVAGDVDLMTELLWEYWRTGEGCCTPPSGKQEEVKCEERGGAAAAAFSDPSRLFSLVERQLKCQSNAPTGQTTLTIGGEVHAMPTVRAHWVPGSIVKNILREDASTATSRGGANAGLYSLAVVFGVVGGSAALKTAKAGESNPLASHMYLCAVLELRR